MSARSTTASTSKHGSASRAPRGPRGLSVALGGLKEELLKPGKRPAMMAGSAFAAYMTLLFTSIAIWWGLATVIDHGWAALIVAAAWAIACATLYVASKRPSATKPSQG